MSEAMVQYGTDPWNNSFPLLCANTEMESRTLGRGSEIWVYSLFLRCTFVVGGFHWHVDTQRTSCLCFGDGWQNVCVYVRTYIELGPWLIGEFASAGLAGIG